MNPPPFKHPSPGRPRNSKDKPKVPTTADLMEQLKELNFNPIKELVTMYRDESTASAVRYKCVETLTELVYPALKATEISGMVEHRNLNISWDANAPEPMTVVDTPVIVIPHDELDDEANE
jgi:hypothetical protein